MFNKFFCVGNTIIIVLSINNNKIIYLTNNEQEILIESLTTTQFDGAIKLIHAREIKT